MRGKDVVLKNVLHEKADKYYSLNNNKKQEPVVFAEHSYLHNQVMEDGNIFNPYIHRRFLPKQYKELLIRVKYRNAQSPIEILKQFYPYEYFLNVVFDEVYKLSKLEHLDYAAYLERSKLWDFEGIKEFLKSYVNIIVDRMKESTRYCSDNAYAIWFGANCSMPCVKVTSVTANKTNPIQTVYSVKATINKFAENLVYIDKAETYTRLKMILQDIGRFRFQKRYTRYIEVPEKILLSFNKAGLYFTYKHYAMFNKTFTYKGKGGNELCNILVEKLENGIIDMEMQEMTNYLMEFLRI